MDCPSCGRRLTQTTAGGIQVDACSGGCGGLWFDAEELPKVEYADEAAGASLLDIPRDPLVVLDPAARRHCPKDPGITMMRHFESVERKVSVDECGQCGGIWLDTGELASIRSEFHTDAERRAAADRYFADVFDAKLKPMLDHDQAFAAKAHSIAWHFRFICPSYFLPGRQPWGAF